MIFGKSAKSTLQNYYLLKQWKILIQLKKVLFTVPYMSKLSLRIFINTRLSVVSDPQILKLNPNEH